MMCCPSGANSKELIFPPTGSGRLSFFAAALPSMGLMNNSVGPSFSGLDKNSATRAQLHRRQAAIDQPAEQMAPFRRFQRGAEHHAVSGHGPVVSDSIAEVAGMRIFIERDRRQACIDRPAE